MLKKKTFSAIKISQRKQIEAFDKRKKTKLNLTRKERITNTFAKQSSNRIKHAFYPKPFR